MGWLGTLSTRGTFDKAGNAYRLRRALVDHLADPHLANLVVARALDFGTVTRQPSVRLRAVMPVPPSEGCFRRPTETLVRALSALCNGWIKHGLGLGSSYGAPSNAGP